jgi:hypothetical protein
MGGRSKCEHIGGRKRGEKAREEKKKRRRTLT